MLAAIVPARNCAPWIRESLQSLASQTCPPDEIILFDDGSTDDTVAVAESLGIAQLRILRGSVSGGISNALNRMLESTSARRIVRMDADDIAEPDRISIQLAAMDAGDLAVVGSWARRFGRAETLHKFAEGDQELKAGLLFAAPFCHPSVIIDRDRLSDPSQLRYDSAFDGAEDHDLWIRLRKSGRFGNVQSVLLNWRLHNDNAGSHPEKLARQLEVQSRLRKRILTEMGVVLDPIQEAVLGRRCSSQILAPDEHAHFLQTLVSVAAAAPSALGTSREAVLKVLSTHWDLSCHFAVHTQQGIPLLWTRGRRRLGLETSYSTLGKILLKSLVRRAKRSRSPFTTRVEK